MILNPVIEKELKIKMRGWKAPALVTVYTGFLAGIVFLFFLSSNLLAPNSYNYFNPGTAVSAFYALASLQLLLLIFIVPAMTGGAISSERERQTLDLLLCTNLNPLSIITGKIAVSISHILLLIIASLPVMGTVFLFGGITLLDLVTLFGFYIATALMLGSIGIFYSTVFRKSSVALIVTYLTVMAILFGTTIGYGIWSQIYASINNKPLDYNYMLAVMFPNPMFGFGSIFEGVSGGNILFDILNLGRGMYSTQITQAPVKPWMANLIFDAAATVIFTLLSAWRIQPVRTLPFRKHRDGSAASQK